MGIDAGWESQAVTGLDVVAMAATNSIASAHISFERPLSGVPDDPQGGKHFSAADITELTANSTTSNMPDIQVATPDNHTGSGNGRLQAVATGAEGSAIDLARESVGITQADQAFSSNLAAHNYAEQTIGRIVDYTA